MARGGSSSRWLQRQARDPFARKRRADGYRARSAYKLLELNRQDRLMRKGSRVLDLGAAPGGWTQVALEICGPGGTVVAVDVLKIEPLPGAILIEGDCRAPDTLAAVADHFPANGADLVMSDMAPNLSGVAARDEAAMAELASMTLDYADKFLQPGGSLLMKLLRYADSEAIVDDLRQRFGSVQRRKPEASRDASREFYVVAKRFGI